MHSILNAQINAEEVSKIIGFTLLLSLGLILLTLGMARLLGWSRAMGSAAVMGSTFMNCANYGLPVVLFAFGQLGFERAAVFVVIQSLLVYTLAVFIAARGRLDWGQAALSILRLPLVWAAACALIVRMLGVTLPEMILKPITLLGNGAIVVMVMVLGMQVAGIKLQGSWGKIAVASLVRLVLSPLIGLALVAWLRPDPLTAKALVLQSAMPTAVNTALIAVQFDAEPEVVSGVVLVTTVLSLLTVTFWVWYLQ